MREGLQTESDRISDAGVDVLHLAQTSVLIKVGDIVPESVWRHPVYALCRGLCALGFGSIYVCGAADYFDDLDEMMRGSNFTQQSGVWLTEGQAHTAATDADVIVDMTNDVALESFCRQLSLARSCPCISVAWGHTWVAMSPSVITAAQLGELSAIGGPRRETITPITRLAAGLALQEVLMLAGNVELAAPLEAMVIYNAAAEDRATGPVEKSWTVDTVADTVLEVVGAGGIGVHLLESLAPMLGHGCELRIFDPDDVGVENIPLQTPYAISDVGCPKAVVIAKKLKQINPALRIRPIPIVYQDRPQHLSCPSARVVCADNWAVRYFANQISVSDGIPLVEAGSSTLAAQQRTYHLGITACLEHRIHNLTEKAAKEKKPESCSRSTALTLPGTNMIIGGILAAEVLKTLDTKRFGFPSRGTITYDARVLRRLGIMDVHPPCEHETHIEANNS